MRIRLISFIFVLSCLLFNTLANPLNNSEIQNNIESNQTSYSITNAFPNLSFVRPVDLQSPNDGLDTIYVVEQRGRIYVFENDNTTSTKTLYLDIESKVNDNGNEQGLLGLAFSPNFTSDNYLYVHYNIESRSRIARFTHNTITQLADPNSEFIIIEENQPYQNHNGGQIAFGADGMLYIAWGDGGSGGDPLNNGQDPSTLLGSILRIDVTNPSGGNNYTIPADNPFVGMANHREEIYAYGLRNPWRFSFDIETQNLWLADVGQNQWEEIDIIIAGGNYGWNTMEGTHCYNPSSNCNTTGLIQPIFEYNHTEGYSVTGGYVYRGNNSPGLVGKYIFADFSGPVWITDATTYETISILNTGTTISSFGTDMNNELYLLSFDGSLYSLVETGYIPPSTSISVTSETITVTTVVNDTTTTITSIRESTSTLISSNSIISNSGNSPIHPTSISISDQPSSIYYPPLVPFVILIAVFWRKTKIGTS